MGCIIRAKEVSDIRAVDKDMLANVILLARVVHRNPPSARGAQTSATSLQFRNLPMSDKSGGIARDCRDLMRDRMNGQGRRAGRSSETSPATAFGFKVGGLG